MTNDYSCSRATAVWRRSGENVYFREFLNFVVYKNTCKLCFRAPLSAVIASIDAPMHPLQRCTRPTAIRGISIFSTFWGGALFALRSPSYQYVPDTYRRDESSNTVWLFFFKEGHRLHQHHHCLSLKHQRLHYCLTATLSFCPTRIQRQMQSTARPTREQSC